MTQPFTDAMLAFDREHIWHPYSSVLDGPPVYPVVAASGVRLELADGRQLIDGMASWWSAIHGYNHPILNKAAHQQLDSMSHVMFGGITHPPAVRLAELLVKLTPEPLNKVFFSDSGSVAVEVAIKMAIQYWHSQGQTQRSKLVSLRNGYHGDTFGAMATCDPVTGMHELFTPVLPKHHFVSQPKAGFADDWQTDDIDELASLFKDKHQEIAALILEPVVQGAGGMHFYPPQYVKAARQLCDQYDILLIADEIATGFGRTGGKLFACEHADISPDILCLGKAMTGGYLSFAATLCNDKVANGICRGDAGVFMHGPTFMANPLACAIAEASIKLLLSSHWQQTLSNLEQQLEIGLRPCAKLTGIAEVRVMGGIGVVELKQAVDMTNIQKAFVDRGVWLRPFGKLVYVMPPYIMSNDDLKTLTGAIYDTLAEIPQQ